MAMQHKELDVLKINQLFRLQRIKRCLQQILLGLMQQIIATISVMLQKHPLFQKRKCSNIQVLRINMK
ncbi:unnamed protein product [Paramecium primaurelia]|uniref:Uncharacterized protein n=1 Tax=Paramecium primaurelia TaxID=5886 RepID=A0A8S1M2G1_PARPR|nr:unnamed protein product [Paramecium primaurelia]